MIRIFSVFVKDNDLKKTGCTTNPVIDGVMDEAARAAYIEYVGSLHLGEDVTSGFMADLMHYSVKAASDNQDGYTLIHPYLQGHLAAVGQQNAIPLEVAPPPT